MTAVTLAGLLSILAVPIGWVTVVMLLRRPAGWALAVPLCTVIVGGMIAVAGFVLAVPERDPSVASGARRVRRLGPAIAGRRSRPAAQPSAPTR